MRSLSSLALPLLLVAVFYLLLIRPQRARQRQAQQLLSKVTAGDRVLTSGGMYGTVVLVDGDDIEVEVYPDVDIRFVKGAIQRILPPEEGTDELTDDDDDAAIDATPDATPGAVDHDALTSGDDSTPVLRTPGSAGTAPVATDPPSPDAERR